MKKRRSVTRSRSLSAPGYAVLLQVSLLMMLPGCGDRVVKVTGEQHGVVEKVPYVLNANSNPTARAYLAEDSRLLVRPNAQDLPRDVAALLTNDIKLIDRCKQGDSERWLIGGGAQPNQHFYHVFRGTNNELVCDRMPRVSGAVGVMSLVSVREAKGVLFETESKPGLWRRLAGPKEEVYLWITRGGVWFVSDGELRDSFYVSPDRTKALIRRNSGSFHSVHILDLDTMIITTIMSGTDENDKSYMTFGYGWTTDGKAVKLGGGISGFVESDGTHQAAFRYVYFPKEMAIYGDYYPGWTIERLRLDEKAKKKSEGATEVQ